MYVFFDMKCTQDLEKRDGLFEHVPKLICAQQTCSKYEAVDGLSADCKQCDKRTHMFWEDPVGDILSPAVQIIRGQDLCYFTQLLLIRRTVSS